MAEDSEDAPGQAFNVFLAMEELKDKLNLLDYENGFCKGLRMKPLTRHYFAIGTNPGEQFYIFTSLCAWLIRTAGGTMDQPQEYDDPNGLISQVLDEIRRLGKSVDFPPSRLKSGCGEACIEVASTLADACLAKKSFHWQLPDYPEEAQDNIDEGNGEDDNDDQEITEHNAKSMLNRPRGADDSNRPEDEESLDEEDVMMEDEGELLDLEGLRKRRTSVAGDAGGGRGQGGKGKNDHKPEDILHSTTDSSEWLLEVERVLPQLKVTIRSDTKDWRSHIDQMHHHKEEIDKCHAAAKSHLDRMHDELARTLEKIQSREKYLNSQMEPLLQEYRAKQDMLIDIREKYRQASGGITERTRTLADISEELDRIKQGMDEHGASMTDGSPIVRIKQAIQRLKQEMMQMDIRVGVLEHTLLQAHLKAKTDTQRTQASMDTAVY